MDDKQYLAKLVGTSADTNLPFLVGEYWIRAYSLGDARILANRHRTKLTTHVFIFALETQYEVPRRNYNKPYVPVVAKRDKLSYRDRRRA